MTEPVRLGQTPAQTVGPYFAMRLSGDGENLLVPDGCAGERIRIEGRVLDGEGDPVEDALVEIWQANASGRYRHPQDTRAELPLSEGFSGFGRSATDFHSGAFWFETIKPGAVPDSQGRPQAPHISCVVQARGMLVPSFTRIYFADCAKENDADPILSLVPAERRATLLAQPDRDSPHLYRFDIRFQGERETVFFQF